MYAPRRATAGGTTRTPVAANSASSRVRELGRHLVVERGTARCAPGRCAIAALSARRNDSSTAFLIHWCVIHAPSVLLGDAQAAARRARRSRARRRRGRLPARAACVRRLERIPARLPRRAVDFGVIGAIVRHHARFIRCWRRDDAAGRPRRRPATTARRAFYLATSAPSARGTRGTAWGPSPVARAATSP